MPTQDVTSLTPGTEMKTTSAQLVFSYWDRLRGERAAPERGEIEPGAVRHALLDTFILENGPNGLIIRLAGTRLCALFGAELRHRAFIDLWPDANLRVELSRMADAVMDEVAGAVAGVTVATASGRGADLELLILPLRHQGKTHARVLGALAPITPVPWLGLEPVTEARLRSMRFIWASGLPLRAPSRQNHRLRFTVVQGGKA
jgi:hypothetical protein